MNRNALLIVIRVALLIGFNFSCSTLMSKDVSDKDLPVKLGPAPAAAARLKPELPISESESARMRQLIRGLADIDKPDFGLSPTLSGVAFAPIPTMHRIESGIIMHHVIEDSSGFVELVKLGPKSLPFLLEALDDKTPTKLVIQHDSFFGGMWFANELDGNPANTNEQAILSWSPRTDDRSQDSLTNYTVTVGDVCFVIVGQIVGRRYEAVRYQPTAVIVINSPAHDPMIAKQVRAIWSSQDCRQRLYDSLLLDYSTEGIFNGRSLDGWGIGSDLQCEAAMRLLYYFPAATTNLIVKRLNNLDVGCSGTLNDYMTRAVSNGVRSESLMESVVWCEEPSIRSAIDNIVHRTDDADVLAVGIQAMDPSRSDMSVRRIEEFFLKNSKLDRGPFVDGYRVLVALGKKFGASAKPAFQAYMKNATVEQLYSMTQVLRETQGQWSIELLTPLLGDERRADHEGYAICYDAAETIALNFPKLSFQGTNDRKSMDAQIAMMRKRIAGGDF